MIFAALLALLILEAVWAAALIVLLALAMASRFGRRKRRPAASALRTAIQRALAVYIGGNTGLAGLQSLAAAHPEEFRNSIREFQGAVSGRCEAVGELAFRLGLVSRWCDAAQSGSPEERRNAFSLIAAVAPYAPVHRLAGGLARRAIDDPDEQVRLAAARLLLYSGDLLQIARLFERLLSDTPLVRILVGPELGVYAGELCKSVVPEALRSAHPGGLVNALNLVTSWERGLPLAGFGRLAAHPDPAVRLAFVRLLPLLPAGVESRQALLRALDDQDPRVHAAAVAAAGRLKILQDPDLVCAGGAA